VVLPPGRASWLPGVGPGSPIRVGEKLGELT
jgi:hypothetical protein